jgi:hypothetical protein
VGLLQAGGVVTDGERVGLADKSGIFQILGDPSLECVWNRRSDGKVRSIKGSRVLPQKEEIREWGCDRWGKSRAGGQVGYLPDTW